MTSLNIQPNGLAVKPPLHLTALPWIVLGLVMRVVYLLQVQDADWFRFPGMDPEYYSNWADAIIAGDAARYIPFPRAPLYPYLLAGLHQIFGAHWLIPRLFNLAADCITIAAVFHLARRLFDRRAGAIAATLTAFCGAGIYYCGEILMESLTVCIATVFLLFITNRESKGRIWNIGAAGLCLGLLAIMRPNAVALIPTFAILLLLRGTPGSTRLRNAVILTATALLPILPVATSNYLYGREFILISTQGGVNFYIGNARGANGWSSELPGFGGNWTQADASHLARGESETALSPGQESRRFWQMGLEGVAASPAASAHLTLKKILLLTGVREIGNNRPLTLAKWVAPQLGLFFYISLGLFVPFIVAGLLNNGWRRERLFVVLYILVYGGTLLLFFVNTRYRLPLYPAAAALAAGGFIGLLDDARRGNFRKRAIVVGIIAALICYPPWIGGTSEGAAQMHFTAGNGSLRSGNYTEALRHYQMAGERNPNYPQLDLNRGVTWLKMGDTSKAEETFRRELEHHPRSPDALNNLGVISQQRGDTSEALDYYRRALEYSPLFKDASSNLARLYRDMGDREYRQGNREAATAYYDQALDLYGELRGLVLRRAIILMDEGDIEKARILLRNIPQDHPDFPMAQQMLNSIPS